MAVLMKKNGALVSVGCSIKTEGTAPVVTEEKDVNFYDYDGSVAYSYTSADFLALSSLPANPSHTGLTAQGWNWSLSDAKTYVTNHGALNIGQNYTTVSGKSEFDIVLPQGFNLTVKLNMNGNKNWGDGVTNTDTTHTYSTSGNYTITCDGDTMTTSTSSGLFGQKSSNMNAYVKNVRFCNISAITDGAFYYCQNVETISIPNSVQSFGYYSLSNAFRLKNINIPNGVTQIPNRFAQSSHQLSSLTMPNGLLTVGTVTLSQTDLHSITFPDTVTTIGNSLTSGLYSLKLVTISNSVSRIEYDLIRNCFNYTGGVKIPSSVTAIAQTAFGYSGLISYYDFSSATAVPTLENTSAFAYINGFCKIIVPDSLYTSWKAASNWATYADYIYKASEVTL